MAMVSATQAGRSLPSISIVTWLVSRTPPLSMASAARSLARARTREPAGTGLTPQGLQAAYKLAGSTSGGRTVAIVDAYGYPSLEADLAKYRSTFKLPPCTTASGCLRILDQNGGVLVTSQRSTAVEISPLELPVPLQPCSRSEEVGGVWPQSCSDDASLPVGGPNVPPSACPPFGFPPASFAAPPFEPSVLELPQATTIARASVANRGADRSMC